MKRQGLWNGVELLGRILLGLLFVLEALSKLRGYAGAASYMETYGVPPVLLPAAIALELGAGLMIIAGWRTRVAAFLLAGFCFVTALIFHTDFSDSDQLIHFQKDFALAGAFLVLWARGAGAWSLDAMRSRAVPAT
ncbi:MAG TPA: DoxX family protein [Rhizobiaceae bacterium]|nr:DoxX family protein [Rhizobiaceae bacterium]